MLLQGQTSEFSLPELFKFLKDSQQTGRLSLKSLYGKAEGSPHYFWFEDGNLVAASERLDGLGLLNLLQGRALLQSSTLPRLLRRCPKKVALGNFLRNQAILTAKQLQSLFAAQVLRNTCRLLQATNVRFAFYPDYPFPYLEMTGVKIQATDITLPSLRMVKDWSNLIEKLPSLDSGLKPIGKDISNYRLSIQERTVLRLAAFGKSLGDIAIAIKLPKLEIQKIGFRLIFVGVASEVPMIHQARTAARSQPTVPDKVSAAFLSKLSSYLQKTADLNCDKERSHAQPEKVCVERLPTAIPSKILRPLALPAAR